MDILHSTSKLVQHASYPVHSLLSLCVYNIDQGINNCEKWVQDRLTSCEPGMLLKFPRCSVWWFSTCRFGDSVPKVLESNAAACLAEFKLIFLLTPVFVISSNFCNQSSWKRTVTARGRGREKYSIPLYVFIQQNIQIL